MTHQQYNLYWGDLHTHFTNFDHGDALLEDTRHNIDFSTVLCYPFVWETQSGLRVESVGQRPEFQQWWETLRELARAHHDPGRFVTFLGYEWHGDRTRYGDHNVIYYDESSPLDDAPTLPSLYQNLRARKALALPHHTGYLPGWRGKDWDVWDPDLSPVMEIFSIHGSSEGPGTPRPLESNSSMGPRAGGGTFHDALARGYRIGVIGSNDYTGLPGRWGIGRAAVWAADCTREAIWEALLARRTYAVTGDRMRLSFSINGAPMGSVIRSHGPVDAEVTLTASDAVDRIELVHNGVVADTYCHSGRWETESGKPDRYKIFVEAGWGPASQFGFQLVDQRWSCRLDVEGGRLVSTEKCFSLPGQRIVEQTDTACAWTFVTAARTVNTPFGMRQGIVFEIEGHGETCLHLVVDGMRIDLSLRDLFDAPCLIPFIEESKQRIERTFHLHAKDLGNVDPYYHNARKLVIHQAIPTRGYRIDHTFRNLTLAQARNDFYIRASQRNGQMAWSSPIWLERG